MRGCCLIDSLRGHGEFVSSSHGFEMSDLILLLENVLVTDFSFLQIQSVGWCQMRPDVIYPELKFQGSGQNCSLAFPHAVRIGPPYSV